MISVEISVVVAEAEGVVTAVVPVGFNEAMPVVAVAAVVVSLGVVAVVVSVPAAGAGVPTVGGVVVVAVVTAPTVRFVVSVVEVG